MERGEGTSGVSLTLLLYLRQDVLAFTSVYARLAGLRVS